MFDEEFYSYEIKDDKRIAYNLDCDARIMGKFAGYDIMDLFRQMIDEGLLEKTVTITLKRYPEDD